MGLLSNLFSRTGLGKYTAAKNALIAKYTFSLLDKPTQEEIRSRVRIFLQQGGIPADDTYVAGMTEDCFYGMTAQVMIGLNIRPALTGLLFRDNWERIDNPLVALSGAENEIHIARDEIVKKHSILVTIDCKSKWLKDDVATASTKEIAPASFTDTCKDMLDKATESTFVSLLKMYDHFGIKRSKNNIIEGGIFISFIIANSFYQASLFLKKPTSMTNSVLTKYDDSIVLELFNLSHDENKVNSIPFDSPIFLELDERITKRGREYIQLLPDFILYENRTFMGLCVTFANNLGLENAFNFYTELSIFLQKSILPLTTFFIEELNGE